MCFEVELIILGPINSLNIKRKVQVVFLQMMNIELNMMMSLSRACQNLNGTPHNIIQIHFTCNEYVLFQKYIGSFEVKYKRIKRYK